MKHWIEWIEYTGSDEQIHEMENAQYGVLLNGIDEVIDVSDMYDLKAYLDANSITRYLILTF